MGELLALKGIETSKSPYRPEIGLTFYVDTLPILDRERDALSPAEPEEPMATSTSPKAPKGPLNEWLLFVPCRLVF